MPKNENYQGAIGTTSPLFIPRESQETSIQGVQPGKNYFYIKIHSAQASFSAPLWQQVKQLVITSSVSLNHPSLGLEPMKGIQRVRAVKKGETEKLGMSPNLVNIVPASMTHVSISIDFLLDTQNRLSSLVGLINDDTFISAISLDPTSAVAARTIGGISQKLLDALFPNPKERQPILQFSGDFNIPKNDLKEGYYVILGTRDKRNPLPAPSAVLEIKGSDLLVNGDVASKLSYIILNVRVLDARSREVNEGASWDRKFREAEAIAERLEYNPYAEKADRERAWEDCLQLISEGRMLLLDDLNYLNDEAGNITKLVAEKCRKKIFGDSSQIVKASRGSEEAEFAEYRARLGIPLDEDLDATLNVYTRQVANTLSILQKENSQ